jgi:thymidylate synthase
MKPYLDFLQRILDKDRQSRDRTGVGTIKVAGEMMKFPLMRDGVKIAPVVTTKKLYFDKVVTELFFFRDGKTNAMDLIAQNNHIWDEWMIPEDIFDTSTEDALFNWMLDNGFDPTTEEGYRKGSTAFCDALQLSKGEGPRSSFPEPAEAQAYLDSVGYKRIPRHAKGELGPIYGETWRRAPAGRYFLSMSDAEVQEYVAMMAPDQKAQLDELLAGHPGLEANRLRVTRVALTKIGIDQLSQALHKLKTNPNDRRIIVDAWTPQYLPIDKGEDMKGLSQAEISQLNVKRGRAALAYCHVLFQFLTEELTEDERLDLLPKRAFGPNSVLHAVGVPIMPPVVALSHQYLDAVRSGKVKEDTNATVDTAAMLDALDVPRYKLNCVMYQRSADAFLGVAFNVASYGVLTHMVAQVNNMLPGELTWMGGDCHIYRNAIEQVKLQLSREPYPEPELWLNPDVKSLFDFKLEDVRLVNYRHHSPIKADVAV